MFEFLLVDIPVRIFSGNLFKRIYIIVVTKISIVVSTNGNTLDTHLLKRFKESLSDFMKSFEVDVFSTIKYITQMKECIDIILFHVWEQLFLKELEKIF
jgi:hypothetical protein